MEYGKTVVFCFNAGLLFCVCELVWTETLFKSELVSFFFKDSLGFFVVVFLNSLDRVVLN